MPSTQQHILSGLICAALPFCGFAAEEQDTNIHSEHSDNVLSSFDIVHTRISSQDNIAIFQMTVESEAGLVKPQASGQLAGSQVYSYVWPTSLDPYEVGFEHDTGILALAVTAHPDFDDTPLFDEDGDNNTGNDGNLWHSHWVVLHANEQCGENALGVVDIPEGSKPRLPKTWPGLPILLDSPGWTPTFGESSVEVRVAFDDIAPVNNARFDGVTAGLRVNASVHSPLLCVINVFDVASGDLSLPGQVEP